LRALPPRRPEHDARCRWHRVGPLHLPRARGGNARPDVGHVDRGRRLDVLVRAAHRIERRIPGGSPRRVMKGEPGRPMEGGLSPFPIKELPMRLYTQIIRLAVLASLVLTAVVCGGWKWEGL